MACLHGCEENRERGMHAAGRYSSGTTAAISTITINITLIYISTLIHDGHWRQQLNDFFPQTADAHTWKPLQDSFLENCAYCSSFDAVRTSMGTRSSKLFFFSFWIPHRVKQFIHSASGLMQTWKYLSCDVCACPSKFSRSSPTLYILTQIQREFPSSINTVASSWHLTQAWQVTAIATTAWEIQETNTGELLERLLKSCVVENIQLHQWPLFKVCCWSDTIINKYFCSLSHK